MSRRGWVLFVALGIIWGLPYLLIKVAVEQVSPSLLVLMRTGGGALVLLPVAAARGELLVALRRWRALLALSLAEMAGPWWLLFNAEKRLPSSLSGLLVASVPLVSALLAVVTGSDRVDLRRLAGLLLGAGGVAALVGFDVGHSQAWAAASMLGVVVGYALGPWIIAHFLTEAPPLGVISWSFAFCAIGYAPIVAFQLPTQSLRLSVVGAVVGLTLVCTVTAFLVFFALVAEVGAMRMTLITYVNPAVAVVLGVAVLGESFSAPTGAGFALILAGCYFASRPVAQKALAVPIDGVPAADVSGGVPAGVAGAEVRAGDAAGEVPLDQ